MCVETGPRWAEGGRGGERGPPPGREAQRNPTGGPTAAGR